MRGWLGLPDGTAFVEDEVSGLASEAHLLGHLLAQRCARAGGDDILAQRRRDGCVSRILPAACRHAGKRLSGRRRPG